jgi:dolichyl-phosphate-mannose--protein O-mannosyl transferase
VPGQGAHVELVGNPVVWWATLIGGAWCLVMLALSAGARTRLARHRDALLLLAVAWAANYLPYALVRRELFVYSYLPAFAFSLAFVVVGCGELFGWMRDEAAGPWTFATRRSAQGYATVAAVALAFYLFFVPVGDGQMISDANWAVHQAMVRR